MRRSIVAGLIIVSGACTSSGDATGPSDVETISVSSNASANGVFVGDQVQLNAQALDVNGNIVPAIITYSSSNKNVATISSTGLIMAIGAGTSSIGVTADGTAGTFTLTVDGNISEGVVVTPVTATIKVGAQQQFAFAVTTTLGNPARGKSVTWTSSDPTRASVDVNGNVTAIAATSGAAICAAATDVPSALGCGTLVVTP